MEENNVSLKDRGTGGSKVRERKKGRMNRKKNGTTEESVSVKMCREYGRREKEDGGKKEFMKG